MSSRLRIDHDYAGQRVAANAIRGKLQTIMAAGKIAAADGNPIDTPHLLVVDADRPILDLDITGTYLELILGYDAALEVAANPQVKLFGRYGPGDRWCIVRNLLDQISATLNTDPAVDIAYGGLRFTTPDTFRNVYDVGRFNQLLVGIEIPLTGAGDTSTAIIQARLWG